VDRYAWKAGENDVFNDRMNHGPQSMLLGQKRGLGGKFQTLSCNVIKYQLCCSLFVGRCREVILLFVSFHIINFDCR
jgi:hypothetical protein